MVLPFRSNRFGSVNRDETVFENPDRFDIHREIGYHLTFAYGAHFFLGATLAGSRDESHSTRYSIGFLSWRSTSSAAGWGNSPGVRGYASLPISIP